MTAALKNTFSSLSPLSILPNELIELIFGHFLSWDTLQESDRRTPTLLGLVCRQWRDVTINCPELWRTLRITGAQMRNMRLILMWLERSKQTPLSIGIWTKGSPYSSQVGEVLKAIAGLNNPQMTERLEELRIELHWVAAIPIADEMENSQTTFPLLRKLRVAVDLEDAEGREEAHSLRADHFLSRIPPRAQKLQALAWRGSPFKPILLSLVASPLIVNSITEIELGNETSLTSVQCMSILSTFEHLRVCIFDDVWNTDEDDPPSSPGPAIITTKYLQKFVLHGEINPLLFLAQLNTPSLEILTIFATGWHGWSEHIFISPSTFSEFLSRSTPPLRELIIKDIPLFDFEWKKCLRLMSTLEVLNVYERQLNRPMISHSETILTHVILETLVRRNPNDKTSPAITSPFKFACPVLRVLVLRGRFNAPDGFLAQLAEDRSAGLAEGLSRALEVVQVDFIKGLHKEDQERLQSLIAAEARAGRVMKVDVLAYDT